MKRKSGGIFSPSPNNKKKVKRTQIAEGKEVKEKEKEVKEKGVVEGDSGSCKGCQRAMKAVAEMEKTIETLSKLRAETDALHKKSVEESTKLAEAARAELSQAKDRADALQQEVEALNAALRASSDEASELKHEVAARQEEVIALKQSALEKESERQQEILQQQKQRRRSSLQLQSPAPLSPAKPASGPATPKKGGKGRSDALAFYGMLTGIAVTPKDDGYECVLENKEKGRTVKFRIVVEDGMAHYTPLTIDVPDRVPAGGAGSAGGGGEEEEEESEVVGCVLTEVVTEPIDFHTSQLPVFLSRLIDELFM